MMSNQFRRSRNERLKRHGNQKRKSVLLSSFVDSLIESGIDLLYPERYSTLKAVGIMNYLSRVTVETA